VPEFSVSSGAEPTVGVDDVVGKALARDEGVMGQCFQQMMMA
jgi:hypothetical protein